MRPPLRTAFSLAGAAALGLLALDQAPEAGLQASSSAAQPLQDTDLDGLHDFLELRLGTSPTMADSDQDGATDLEEYLSGRDPMAVNSPTDALLEDPALKVNLYQHGGTVYLQAFAASATSIENVQIGAAGLAGERWAAGARAAVRSIEKRSIGTQVAGKRVHSITIPVPASELKSLVPCAIGVVGCVDGEFVGSEIQLVEVANEIHEVRELPNSGANKRSGLFPALPDSPAGAPASPDRNPSEVCVQSMSTAGSLGPGSVIYTVNEAYCDFLPMAFCLTDCRLTRGDTVVGLDIPGLVGSLGN